MFINNARWDGVPFLLKAGKALHSRRAEIRVQFRHVPGNLYRNKMGLDLDRATNELVCIPSGLGLLACARRACCQMSKASSISCWLHGLIMLRTCAPWCSEPCCIRTCVSQPDHQVCRD